MLHILHVRTLLSIGVYVLRVLRDLVSMTFISSFAQQTNTYIQVILQSTTPASLFNPEMTIAN